MSYKFLMNIKKRKKKERRKTSDCRGKFFSGYEIDNKRFYKRRPRRPPFLRVQSDGIGVTSSTKTKQG